MSKKTIGRCVLEITPKEDLIRSRRYEILILTLLESQLCSWDILGEILPLLCFCLPACTLGTRILTSAKCLHAKTAEVWILSGEQKDKSPVILGQAPGHS